MKALALRFLSFHMVQKIENALWPLSDVTHSLGSALSAAPQHTDSGALASLEAEADAEVCQQRALESHHSGGGSESLVLPFWPESTGQGVGRTCGGSVQPQLQGHSGHPGPVQAMGPLTQGFLAPAQCTGVHILGLTSWYSDEPEFSSSVSFWYNKLHYWSPLIEAS